jgi:preprotein translocase subunit SecY
LELGRQGALAPELMLGLALLIVAATALIVFVQRARRGVPVEYAASQADGPAIDGRSQLTLRINYAGIIPPLLASWVIMIAVNLLHRLVGREFAWWSALAAELLPGRPWFMAIYAVLIVGFSFFYVAFVLDPDEAAGDLAKYGGVVPGVDSGEPTAQYLDGVVSRLTTVGAVYLTSVCLLPELLIGYAGVPFYLGGTSFLVVVCTVLDMDAQVRNLCTRRNPNDDDQAREATLIEARG